MPIATKPPKVPRSGLDYLKGDLPECSIPMDTDAKAVATKALEGLNTLDESYFTEDALWRDQFAMTGTFRTLYEGPVIRAAWLEISKDRKPSNFKLVDGSAKVIYVGQNNSFVEARFTFETTGGGLDTDCSGFINVIPVGDEWKVWCLMTILEEFKGHEMADLRALYPRENLTNGVSNLSINGTNGHANGSTDALETTVDTIVVGAGQSGLCNATYLKALGVDYLLIERNENVGDNWKNRYRSLKLHTPHAFNNLCFGPTFSKELGNTEWLLKDELAKGYQDHAKRYQLNVWTSSNIISTTHSKDTELWTMKVERNGKLHTVIARYLILASGPGGSRPILPHYPGVEKFKGEIMHSVTWDNPDKYAGKKAIVIGTANTGHDIVENLMDVKADVTMVQRSHTFVLPRDYFTNYFDYVWSPDRTQEVADRYFWSPPTAVARLATMNYIDPMIAGEPERFDALEKVGFKVDRLGDFIDMLLVRFGGHFMDHGCSSKIAKGLAKVKSDSLPVAYTETGLEFGDGTKVDADVVIFATGFEKSTTESAATIVGDEIADQLDPFWGCDEEGEVKGAFKPCGFKNLWMTGGGCAHARYYTRFTAMQIKADKLGQPLKLYLKTPVV